VLVIGRNAMRTASIVALAAMLISSLGVANVVLAGIDARRFEFGVLRAVGASRGLVGRLIVGEVVLLVLTASILGTLLGVQASNVAVTLYRLLAGIRLQLRPDAGAIGLAWGMLLVVTLGVTGPLIVRVVRTSARELLASTRG
jgi:putative ABC transport system permease protein